MQVEVVDKPLAEVDADLHCLALFDGDELPPELRDARGAADLKTAYKKLTMLRPERPERVLVTGLGKREEYDAERARVVAAMAVGAAKRYEARALAWSIRGAEDGAGVAAAVIEGTALAAYSFDRFKSKPEEEGEQEEAAAKIERLVLVTDADLAQAAEATRVVAEAANRARELQNLPGNVATPTFLAERAREIAAASDAVTCEVLDHDQIKALGMGGLIAVAQGSAQPPHLIVLRYAGAGEGADTLGLVGKAVTFDTGGISIKPAQGMQEMKMDMSGGGAVLEAVAAIAELGLAVNLIAVVPTTENMPSGTAIKPGDIITQHNGKTVEINNTDAEGRLILADALSFCAEQGADRIVDLATLTGAVVVALGSTYAALISNDDELAGRVEAAANATGELAWRLPLHEEFKDLTRGKVADLTNASDKRKAGTLYAASFLEEFVDSKPWVHLDIAGTSWDVGREYVGSGATGYGVRLLVELARGLSI